MTNKSINITQVNKFSKYLKVLNDIFQCISGEELQGLFDETTDDMKVLSGAHNISLNCTNNDKETMCDLSSMKVSTSNYVN